MLYKVVIHVVYPHHDGMSLIKISVTQFHEAYTVYSYVQLKVPFIAIVFPVGEM